MLNFGTSAYLKLLALNPKPRDTELRNRLVSSGGGYDFHKRMRRIATLYATGNADWGATLRELNAINEGPERTSATHALGKLTEWLGGQSAQVVVGGDVKAVSPTGLFSVKFAPDFGLDLNGKRFRVHIWNTKQPAVRLREAIGTIGLFSDETDASELAILSLRTGELFASANVQSAKDLALLLARDIERRIVRLREELADERRPRGPESDKSIFG